MDYFRHDVKQFTAPRIAESPDSMFRAVVFVLATIQQRFDTVPQIMRRLEEEGVKSKFLFGSKRAGYEFASENRRLLHKLVRGYARKSISLEGLILEFMEIPGLGLAKASFLAQIAVGNGACLDRHNLRFLGLPESFVKTNKSLKPENLAGKVEAYNVVWQNHGNSAFWWNSWCDHVATMYPKSFANGAAVSAIHRLAV